MSKVNREFEENGFVTLRGLLNPQEVSEPRDQLEHYQRDVLP